ncbi:hypothetical protein QHF89_14095, partial [Polyangium sorediatum]
AARAKGTVARAKGTVARAKGNEARAKGNEARAKGTVARAKGTVARAKGTEARAKGNEARAKGNEARAKGTVARAKGNEGELAPLLESIHVDKGTSAKDLALKLGETGQKLGAIENQKPQAAAEAQKIAIAPAEVRKRTRAWATVAETILANLEQSTAPAAVVDAVRAPLLAAAEKATARRRPKRLRIRRRVEEGRGLAKRVAPPEGASVTPKRRNLVKNQPRALRLHPARPSALRGRLGCGRRRNRFGSRFPQMMDHADRAKRPGDLCRSMVQQPVEEDLPREVPYPRPAGRLAGDQA